ncbi:uncharacterized protein TRUGW13939_03749 [Talaromyces rugulosus]|uniref:Uncharacterized protein n=1 Tax=Talaromyces rugulosus TaxID=121627 RepID=A0A7H8QUG8_TALRU|nr:uncharacterized protein TRUGW13939_03749 [Talaromyces rugulosus]QKX56643.1 hypothetical protein TRUGW13939_03749 [Talaromyces rugulosus]
MTYALCGFKCIEDEGSKLAASCTHQCHLRRYATDSNFSSDETVRGRSHDGIFPLSSSRTSNSTLLSTRHPSGPLLRNPGHSLCLIKLTSAPWILYRFIRSSAIPQRVELSEFSSLGHNMFDPGPQSHMDDIGGNLKPLSVGVNSSLTFGICVATVATVATGGIGSNVVGCSGVGYVKAEFAAGAQLEPDEQQDSGSLAGNKLGWHCVGVSGPAGECWLDEGWDGGFVSAGIASFLDVSGTEH